MSDKREQRRQRRMQEKGSSYDESSRRRSAGRRDRAEADFSHQYDSRLRKLMGFAVVMLVIAVARLAFLQIIDGPRLARLAEESHSDPITLHAHRGTIYDRSGNVLAMSVDCETIYCNPKEVNHPTQIAAILVDNLGGTPKDYIGDLTADTTFIYIRRQVDEDVAQTIREQLQEAGLTGIYFLSDSKRVYPYGATGGQVLGFVGVDGEGISGLELYYDDILSGVDGEMTIELGNDGTPIAGGASEITPAQDGTDIIISIDIDIQAMAEEKIIEGVADYGAQSGFVMVTDPTTGEILAACSTPFADLTRPSTIDYDGGALSLKLVSDSYDPGSIFKLLTMAIGIDAGLITPNSTFNVPWEVLVGDDGVHDDDGRDYSMDMDVREILRRSSNTGAALVAQNVLGEELFWEGINRFGIGATTGIDYPGEVAGIVRDISDWDGSTLGSMAFGQGLAIPMVQMVRAVGALANEGILETPHFLVTAGGEEVEWEDGARACSVGTASQVVDMMVTVVEEGTATGAQVPGYEVAGKTGTAQQAGPGGYSDVRFLSSLVGFAPASNPQVLVYVGLNGTNLLAGSSSAYVFSAIMGEALTDMAVPQG